MNDGMSFKSSIYFEIYGDIWNLHKSYYNIQDNEDFWDKLIQSASEIYKKYEGKPEFEFAKQLALSVVEELDRSYRRCTDRASPACKLDIIKNEQKEGENGEEK